MSIKHLTEYIYLNRRFMLYPMAIFLFIQAHRLHLSANKPELIINLQQEVVNITPKIIEILSLGQKKAISSLLWTETMLKSDLAHYKKKDLKSWMYLRLNTITDLDPYFYEAYLYGGMYLSIIKDDDYGAKEFFDKGLNIYPDKYPLLFQAGFHYFSELNNIEMAIKVFERALLKKEAVHFLPSLVARLKSGNGDLEGAKLLLEQRLETLPKNIDGHISKRLRNSLYAVQAEIDLKCLDGNDYIKSNNRYHSKKNWKPFRSKN
jgi:tetratricopeptide (TPR) repeat protein